MQKRVLGWGGKSDYRAVKRRSGVETKADKMDPMTPLSTRFNK